ncbi:glycosyltransferase [Chloroflexota bacterium]
MKTILIKTKGGHEIGMGHAYRSLGLSRELEKDYKIVFYINDNPQVKALMCEHSASYFTDGDIEKLESREKIDLLLIDQLSCDDGLPQRLKTRFHNLKVVALDFFDYENGFIDVIINLFNQNLEKPKPDRGDVWYYEGLEYAIIRHEFQTRISQKMKTLPRISKVLVTFGSMDAKDNTGRAIKLLESAGLREIELDVILGPLWKGSLPTAPGLDIRDHHSVSASVMADMMAEADIAFCGSGTTVLELLAVGTPAIIFPQNKWERRFAISIEQKGAIKVIQSDVTQPQDISHISSLFASFQVRSEMSQRGKALVDGKGKERIRNIINPLLGMEN